MPIGGTFLKVSRSLIWTRNPGSTHFQKTFPVSISVRFRYSDDWMIQFIPIKNGKEVYYLSDKEDRKLLCLHKSHHVEDKVEMLHNRKKEQDKRPTSWVYTNPKSRLCLLSQRHRSQTLLLRHRQKRRKNCVWRRV